MKLFSRKAIAAVATTVALTTAGLSAPAFAQSSETTTATTTTQAPALSPELLEGSSTTTEKEDGAGTGSSEDMNVEEISDWVGVFTAVVGFFSTAFGFIQRITA